jgi:hypothetical protein
VLQEEEVAPLEKKEGTDVFFLRDNKHRHIHSLSQELHSKCEENPS